jgi:hypothetical protein
MILTTSVGVLGLGFGSFFGIRAFSKRSDADHECSGSFCTQRGLNLYSDARLSATVSTIGFGVAAAAAVTLTALILFPGGTSKTKDASKAWATPLVFPGGAGAAMGTRF